MKQNLSNWKNRQTSQTNQSVNNSDDFYNELDKKISHSSCCTCQTLITLFIGLALVLSGFIFFIYWQITHGGILTLPKIKTTSMVQFNSKLQNPVISDNRVTIELTDSELNAALSEGLSVNNYVIKDLVLTINPKEILIYGNLIKPISSKIVVICYPVAEDGKVRLRVNKTTAGKITLPVYINNKTADSLNSILDTKMAPFYQLYKVDQVTLGQNKIIISGYK